jgi:hypothetical protein
MAKAKVWQLRFLASETDVQQQSRSDSPFVDCAGLTAAQCHDIIINPPTLPDSVLPQDPEPNPANGYPTCSAI